jgi:hypothetical protein
VERADLGELGDSAFLTNRRLVRRLEHDDGPSDEGLRKDFSWAHTPAIVEWERGDLGAELVEVSHEQASKIIEYFRQKWGPHGQPLDS